MLYSFFILPRRRTDENIMLELVKHCQDKLIFLPNIIYDSYFEYKNTITNNTLSNIVQNLNINLEYEIRNVIEYTPYQKCLIKFYDNNVKNCTFYNYYRTLLNCNDYDYDYDKLGIYYDENMCKKQLAIRIHSFFNQCKPRINIAENAPKFTNCVWLAVNLDSLNNYAINKNNLTPSAIIASNLEGYEEYAKETNIDIWKEDNSIYFIHKNGKNYCGHTLNQLLNATDSQQTLLKCNENYNFKLTELEDLYDLLLEINNTKSNNLIKLIKNILDNQRYSDLIAFKTMTSILDISQMQLLKEYFMCYFYLLNYLRFWPGPGYEIKVREINKNDIRIYMRNEIVNYFIPVIQEYREELAKILGDDWDKDILLMSKPYCTLAIKNEEIHNNGTVTYINVNSLHGRLVLLSRNLFCSAIYCENAMLYINAITSYLSMDVNNKNIKTVLQNLSNETMTNIFKRMLKQNLYYQDLQKEIKDKDSLIFNNMLQHYIKIKNDRDLFLPTFVDKNTIKIIDDKISIDKEEFKHNIQSMGIRFTEKINHVYAEAYQYYFAIYNYFTITTFIEENFIQKVGNINQYTNIYHTVNFEDSNKITNYYDFV
jgi:DNA-binding transcriptional MerR regulator